jgi:hypothetical protein
MTDVARANEIFTLDNPMDEMAAFVKMWVAFHEKCPEFGLVWFIQHYQDGELLSAPTLRECPTKHGRTFSMGDGLYERDEYTTAFCPDCGASLNEGVGE